MPAHVAPPTGLHERVVAWLAALCSHRDRHPGRPGNRSAVQLFERAARAAGLEVRTTDMEVVDWEAGEATLLVDGLAIGLQPGPYANGTDVTAPLSAAGSVEELEALDLDGRIVLLHGEICREQLTPKGYPFYEVAGHARILAALEAAEPAAIVAATGRNPQLAGSLYPFPLIEDAAFDIPHAYTTDVAGLQLLEAAGQQATLRIVSRRIPAQARQVVASKEGSGATGGPGSSRIVLFAHIDTKAGTPGALDNATGVAALLGLAELLADYSGPHSIELVPLNGEDYYAAPGEKLFMQENEGRWHEIVLGINLDGAGHIGRRTAISLYGCPPEIASSVRAAMAASPGLVEGEPWHQGDHGLFLMAGRPAVAITSEDAQELLATVIHTSADNLDLVDPAAVVDIARFLARLVKGLA